MSLIATNICIQPLELHAGQGIFFFSSIAALEAFFRTVCSRRPSWYLLIIYCLKWEVCQVKECPSLWPVCVMSRQILSQYFFLYLNLSRHGNYSICTSDNCVITILPFNFVRLSGISRGFTEDEFRQQPAPNRHPLSVSGARCAEALVWASDYLEESSEMQRWIRFFMVFLYFSAHLIITFHSINPYECCNEP